MAAKTKVNPKGKRRIFVYGTLKKGHYNHKAYLGEAEYLGRCVLRGKYAMLDITHFPGLIRTDSIPNSPTCDIVGEVYCVDEPTMDAIDILEGNGYHYTRTKVKTPWKNAWCYFLPTEAKKRFKVIESGMWKPGEEEQTWYENQRAA